MWTASKRACLAIWVQASNKWIIIIRTDSVYSGCWELCRAQRSHPAQCKTRLSLKEGSKLLVNVYYTRKKVYTARENVLGVLCKQDLQKIYRRPVPCGFCLQCCESVLDSFSACICVRDRKSLGMTYSLTVVHCPWGARYYALYIWRFYGKPVYSKRLWGLRSMECCFEIVQPYMALHVVAIYIHDFQAMKQNQK